MPSKPVTFQQRFAYIMHVVPGGALLFAFIPLVVCGYLGWYYYGSKKLDQALYALAIEQITLTEQPTWIQASVLSQVYEDNRLDRINLLDPSASASIASAFETHPWVEKTARVQKIQGRGVNVDVVYRKPLAMIQVHYYPTDETGAPTNQQMEGYYPVDHRGVVLPVDDFKQNSVNDWSYPIIEIEGMEYVTAQAGLSFNDVRVLEALTLLIFLEKQSQPNELGVQWVRVRRDATLTNASPWILELWTTDQRMVVWGRSPGQEAKGEIPAEGKLSVLTNWLETQRQSTSGSTTLNLLENRTSQASSRL